MKHTPIDYKTCLDLGFKHIHLGDQLFIDQYGFDWFTLDMKVMKKLWFTWDCNTRLVTLIRGTQKNLRAETPIYNLEHLKQMIDFFTIDREPKSYS